MKRIIFSLLILFLAPFVFWNLSFGFYIGYILLLLFYAGIHLFIKTKKLKFVFYGIAVGFAAYVVSFPFITEVQLAKVQREYISRIRAGNELNTIEKFNIYGLNAVAVTVAFPIFPEVAKEAGLMMFKTQNGVRRFESDFFLKSSRIQEAIRSGKKEGQVQWYKKDYHNSEARVSLALNICDYKILPDGRMQVSADINYPQKSEVIIGNKYLRVTVEEGLFRYLVDQGWLHRYTAVWTSKSKIPADQLKIKSY